MNITDFLKPKIHSFYLWFLNQDGNLVTFPANNVTDEDHALRLAAEYGFFPGDLYLIQEVQPRQRPKYCYY